MTGPAISSANFQIAIEIDGPPIPLWVFVNGVGEEAVTEMRLDSTRNPDSPAGGIGLSARFVARIDVLAGTRTHGPSVYLGDGLDLRSSQAFRPIRAGALENGGIEVTSARTFEKAVFYSVEFVAFGEHSLLNQLQLGDRQKRRRVAAEGNLIPNEACKVPGLLEQQFK